MTLQELEKALNAEVTSLARKDNPRIKMLKGLDGWIVLDITGLPRFWDFQQDGYVLARLAKRETTQAPFEQAYEVFQTVEPYEGYARTC